MAEGAGGAHDVGGALDLLGERLPADSHGELAHWEKSVDALFGQLARKRLLGVDALRRGIEALPPQAQASLPYYAKWAASVLQGLLASGALSEAELPAQLKPGKGSPVRRAFAVGAAVRVRPYDFATAWRRPHLRTPGFVFGAVGVVERVVGDFPNPEQAAFVGAAASDRRTLYRVRFDTAQVWAEAPAGAADEVDVEVYEPWLEPAGEADGGAPPAKRARHAHAERRHDDEHGDHVHLPRDEVEQTAVDREGPDAAGQALAEAVVECVLAKGLVSRDELRAAIDAVDGMGANEEGPRIVARAWADPGFKARLLEDATAACAELGITATNNTAPTVLVAVENTESVHNLVVCTLCSCYPRAVLGMSPAWYKSRAYRARAVREPRAVLRELGTALPPGTAVRVHDSTADCRYIVLPRRPDGTEGWSEARLRSLVTRDAMIGVAAAKQPG